MIRVLFDGSENICRPPLARGVFENVVRREGLTREIFTRRRSAGG